MSKKALCIGINDYPGTHMDLSGCVNDAMDWAQLLEKKGFSIELLLDSRATGKAIRQGIHKLVQAAKPGDVVIVQYSGHGTFIPDEDGDEADGTDECLCPYDIMTRGPITDDELFTLFSQRKDNVKVVMIADSCNSGTVSKFIPIRTPSTTSSGKAPQRLVRFMPPAVFLKKNELAKLGSKRALRASNPPGRYASLLLSGCQDCESSSDAWFKGRPNGAFTYVALETFKKLAPTATYRDWHKAIRKWLPSQQYPQSPNLYGSEKMKMWKIFR